MAQIGPRRRSKNLGNQNDDHSLNFDVVGDCGVERLSDGEALADALKPRRGVGLVPIVTALKKNGQEAASASQGREERGASRREVGSLNQDEFAS